MAVVTRLLSLCISLLLFSGCAVKPWQDPMEGESFDETLQLINTLTEKQKSCGQSFDADLSLFYTTPFESKAIKGYLNFSSPSAYKFIMTNPFGQPFFLVAGDLDSYQVINVTRREYLAGKLKSFFLRNQIPPFFLTGNWWEWLTGRNTVVDPETTTIRQDKTQRGVWVTNEHSEAGKTIRDHLLLDTEKMVYLERLLENSEGELFAKITYADWSLQTECRQPLDITFSGLDYGTEIRLMLADVRFENTRKKYPLPIPKGYSRQFMP